MKCVVSVLGKDRSGIVAEVATALAECGANIDDISQTILDDIFSMTMLTTLNPEVADFNTVQEKLEAVGESLGVQIIVQREDVFQMMYKIYRPKRGNSHLGRFRGHRLGLYSERRPLDVRDGARRAVLPAVRRAFWCTRTRCST